MSHPEKDIEQDNVASVDLQPSMCFMMFLGTYTIKERVTKGSDEVKLYTPNEDTFSKLDLTELNKLYKCQMEPDTEQVFQNVFIFDHV